MLVAILVLFCTLVWAGIVCVYFKREIGAWLDNRYGPDSRAAKPPASKKQFWRFYG